MPAIPREPTPDSSAAFLREGYEFVSNRCRRLHTDAFRTRLLLRPAICMRGPEAARFFYTTPMTRRRALPRPVLGLVQDALVAQAVRTLTRELRYTLPVQDLRLRPSHLPPRPESGVVMREVAPR